MIYLLSDTFARINLGGQRKSKFVVTLNSLFCLKNLLLIYSLGFIISVGVLNFKYMKVFLKYYFNSALIRGITVLSKKRNKIYVKFVALKKLIYVNKFLTTGFLGISVSIKPFICSDMECLLKRIGGFLSFYVN